MTRMVRRVQPENPAVLLARGWAVRGATRCAADRYMIHQL